MPFGISASEIFDDLTSIPFSYRKLEDEVQMYLKNTIISILKV